MRDEGAGGEDKKLEQLHQEFDELRIELVKVKKCTECKKEVMVKERNVGDRCRPRRLRSLWRRCRARTSGTPPAERQTSEGPRRAELRPTVRSRRRSAWPAWRPGAATARIASGERGPPPPRVPVHSRCYFSSFLPATMSGIHRC